MAKEEFTEKEKELASNVLQLQANVHNQAKYLTSAFKGNVKWKDRNRLVKRILESYDSMTDTVLKMMLIKEKAQDEKA